MGEKSLCDTDMKIIPVILAGGRGERFWPLSRITKPKQSLALMSEKPMILETYERLQTFDEFFVIANQILCESFKSVLPAKVQYIVEPVARNTAPAIGLACAYLWEKYGECIVFFETADHYYENPTNYRQEINKACDFAMKSDKIVLIGINPDHPHTGYGYIEQGDHIEGDFYEVHQFKEKPNIQQAENYLKSGTFSWNSGMFIAKVSVLLREIGTYIPELEKILTQLRTTDFNTEVLTELFPQAPKISIDYGVMEKSSHTVLLHSSIQWDDIGDFNAISRHFPTDGENNVYHAKTMSIQSKNNIVMSDKLVSLIGIENLVIIDTEDALLVCHRDETQKIRDIVKKLEKKYV